MEVIPDTEIESIRKIVEIGFSAEPRRYLSIGWKVRVHAGIYEGVEGRLVSVNKDLCKIAVGISVIEQALMITLNDKDVHQIIVQ